MHVPTTNLTIASVVLLLLTTAAVADRFPFQCVAPKRGMPSTSFCRRPPTVPVDLPTYAGLWFNTFITGSAVRFSRGTCITANYTQTRNGDIAVLNCNQRRRGDRPNCVKAVARKRKDVPDPGKLLVSFPGIPRGLFNPGQYNVVALLGDKNSGYYAAAAYQCVVLPDGVRVPGFFILSRSPLFPRVVLFLLKLKLRCYGYDVSVFFKEVPHDNCRYFYERPGFSVARPGPP